MAGIIVSANEEEKKVFAIMILETLKGGELYYHIKRAGKLNESTARYFVLQLANALKHIHSKGYAHRDLKPWNIMVNDDLTALKIIDFGYATPIESSELEKSSVFLRRRLSGTKNYMPPELFEEEICSSLEKSDIFALGVILINFLTGAYPFDKVLEAGRESQ